MASYGGRPVTMKSVVAVAAVTLMAFCALSDAADVPVNKRMISTFDDHHSNSFWENAQNRMRDMTKLHRDFINNMGHGQGMLGADTNIQRQNPFNLGNYGNRRHGYGIMPVPSGQQHDSYHYDNGRYHQRQHTTPQPMRYDYEGYPRMNVPGGLGNNAGDMGVGSNMNRLGYNPNSGSKGGHIVHKLWKYKKTETKKIETIHHKVHHTAHTLPAFHHVMPNTPAQVKPVYNRLLTLHHKPTKERLFSKDLFDH